MREEEPNNLENDPVKKAFLELKETIEKENIKKGFDPDSIPSKPDEQETVGAVKKSKLEKEDLTNEFEDVVRILFSDGFGVNDKKFIEYAIRTWCNVKEKNFDEIVETHRLEFYENIVRQAIKQVNEKDQTAMLKKLKKFEPEAARLEREEKRREETGGGKIDRTKYGVPTKEDK